MSRGRRHGALNPQWKGGRTVASNGYVLVRVGVEHPLADVRGYAYEHRLVATEKIGRPLRADEQVHHIDGDKTNNAPSNLEVLTIREHRAEHRTAWRAVRIPGEANELVACECGCGGTFERYDALNRPRRFLPGHNPHLRSTQDALLRVIGNGISTRAEIIRATGLTKSAVAVALTRLKERGVVINDARGVWRKAVNDNEQ